MTWQELRALTGATKDQILYALTVMVAARNVADTYTPKLTKMKGTSSTIYHFQYRGLNEPDRIKRGNR